MIEEGGAGLDPEKLPIATGIQDDDLMLIVRDGVFMLAPIPKGGGAPANVVTVNGEAVTVNGEYVVIGE